MFGLVANCDRLRAARRVQCYLICSGVLFRGFAFDHKAIDFARTALGRLRRLRRARLETRKRRSGRRSRHKRLAWTTNVVLTRATRQTVGRRLAFARTSRARRLTGTGCDCANRTTSAVVIVVIVVLLLFLLFLFFINQN